MGKGFLKRIPFTLEPRPPTVRWDLAELKRAPPSGTGSASCPSDKGLVPGYTKNSESRVKKTNDQICKWTMDPNREFAKEEIKVGKKQLKNCSLSLTLGDEHQNNCGSPSFLVRMGMTEQRTDSKCWRGCGERDPLCCWWMASWSSSSGNQCGKFSES